MIYVNSGRRSGQGAMLGVLKLDFDSYERYLDFDTGVPHRISSRVYPAEWFGLGISFVKNKCLGLISKKQMSLISGNKTTQNGFVHKRAPKSNMYQWGIWGTPPDSIRVANIAYKIDICLFNCFLFNTLNTIIL